MTDAWSLTVNTATANGPQRSRDDYFPRDFTNTATMSTEIGMM